MNQKGFVNILLIVLVVAVVAIGGYFVFSKRSIQPGPTTSPVATPAQKLSEPVGKWAIISVEENDIQVVSEGSGAIIEFLDNGTYKTSGGCNEMSISSYTTSDSRISFKVGGTKRKCANNIVEFWDLAKVYSYGLNDKILLLRYRTDDGVEGIFKLQES